MDEFGGSSLKDFVEWCQAVLAKYPDAEVWTYESTRISVYLSDDCEKVVIS